MHSFKNVIFCIPTLYGLTYGEKKMGKNVYVYGMLMDATPFIQ